MFKEKKCLLRKLFIIVALLSAVLFLSLKSIDVSAVSPNTKKINFYLREFDQQAYSWSQYRDPGFSHAFSGVAAVRQYGIQYENLYTTGNYASLHFETNIVAVTERSTNYASAFSWLNRDRIVVKHCTFNGSSINIETNNISTAVTTWWQQVGNNWLYSSTLTVYGDVTLSGIPNNTGGTFVCDIGTDVNNDYFWSNEDTGSFIYWEKNESNMIFGSSLNESLLQTQIEQNNTIINQSTEYYDKTYESVDNIENQSSSDVEGATNGVTTNLIGLISSFMNEISSFSATTCVIAMPFPSFMGGSTNVNVCQGKDVLGNFVTVMATGALIFFYIPFAWVLLTLIYKEIRSWTNG